MSNAIQDNMIAAAAANNIPKANTDIVEGEVVNEGEVILAPRTKDVAKANTEIDNDVTAVRTNIYNLVTKGDAAVEELAEIARQSQHPRAYEVLGALIKNLADVNKDLLNVHKTKKELKKDEEPSDPIPSDPNINIEKAVFVGTTSELLAQLKKSK